MRSLEAIWLIIGLIMLAMLIYDLVQFPSHTISDRLVYIIGLGMAIMMYTFRRKQRRIFNEKQQKKSGNNGQAN
jgi:uncharacterized protein YacL